MIRRTPNGRHQSRLPRVLVPAFAALLGLGYGASAAQASTFGSTQAVSGTGSLYSISCWDGHHCVAVGNSADGASGVVVPVTDDLAGNAQDVGALSITPLDSVACDSGGSTDCIATTFSSGSSGDLVAIKAGTAGTNQPIANFDTFAVACPPGSSKCIAVGSDSASPFAAEVLQIDDGVPKFPAVVATGVDFFVDVACSAVDDCVAIGHGGGTQVAVQITNGQPAAPQPLGVIAGRSIDPAGETGGIACYAKDNCFAVGSDTNASSGLLVPISAGAPGAPSAMPSMGSLGAIACPPSPANYCIAVGSDPSGNPAMVPIHGDGTAGPVTEEPDIHINFALPDTGIACPSATDCVAVTEEFSGGAVVPIAVSQLDGPPTATITSPTGSPTYARNDGSETFGFSCSPPSGTGAPTVSSCVGTLGDGTVVTDGETIDTSTPGNYTLTVTATDSDGGVATASSSYTVSLPGQTITWVPPGSYPFAHAPVQLTATASSGLPVKYTVLGGPCTVDNSTSPSVLTSRAQDPACSQPIRPGTETSRRRRPSTGRSSSSLPRRPPAQPAARRRSARRRRTSRSTAPTTRPIRVTRRRSRLSPGPAHGTLSGVARVSAAVKSSTPRPGATSGQDNFAFKSTNRRRRCEHRDDLDVVAPAGGAPTVTITTPVQGRGLPQRGPSDS